MSFLLTKRGLSEEGVDASDNREDEEEQQGAGTSSLSQRKSPSRKKGILLFVLISLLGAAVCIAFITLGVDSANSDEDIRFEKQASKLVTAIETTWDDYRVVGLWIQEACRPRSTGTDAAVSRLSTMCSHQEFQELYEYCLESGLTFQGIGFCPNITHAERDQLQQDSAKFLFAQDFPYFGILGVPSDEEGETPNGGDLQLRSEQPFYFPMHYILPLKGQEFFVDLDMYSSFKEYVDLALSTWTSLVTTPINLGLSPTNFVILFHPGVQVSTPGSGNVSSSVSAVYVNFVDLITRATKAQTEQVTVYIYEANPRGSAHSFFYGAVSIKPKSDGNHEYTYLEEVGLDDLPSTPVWGMEKRHEAYIQLEDRRYKVIVFAEDDEYKSNPTYIYVGGAVILFASVCIGCWVYAWVRREARICEVQNAAEAEKAALLISKAEAVAESERHINDYLAHEVRNPLSAALTATSFLSRAHKETSPVAGGEESYQTIKEDIGIIDNSLNFIHDLLRTILDMHRTERKQLKLDITPTDLLNDILEPVKTILHRRDNPFEILVECPENLVILTDRMRLKQVILNLASNSCKFVRSGFIRMSAKLVDGATGVDIKDHNDTSSSDGACLMLFVDDSGPGIPKEKRKYVFQRFQESLDLMNQGTGVGLSLCKGIIDLMEGEIRLDEGYESGIAGCPGTRFSISLDYTPAPHLSPPSSVSEKGDDVKDITSVTDDAGSEIGTLASRDCGAASAVVFPEQLSILIVDDSAVLRKLLGRSLKRLFPGWITKEAANGETALKMAEEEQFDLIFMDQYMSSTEKQLLGTETTQAMRAAGVTSCICGLSANDIEETFLKVGANAFARKPFPTNEDPLKRELVKILGL